MMELPKRHATTLHGQPPPARVAAVHARSEGANCQWHPRPAMIPSPQLERPLPVAPATPAVSARLPDGPRVAVPGHTRLKLVLCHTGTRTCHFEFATVPSTVAFQSTCEEHAPPTGLSKLPVTPAAASTSTGPPWPHVQRLSTACRSPCCVARRISRPWQSCQQEHGPRTLVSFARTGHSLAGRGDDITTSVGASAGRRTRAPSRLPAIPT
jgi:hypothetical protein